MANKFARNVQRQRRQAITDIELRPSSTKYVFTGYTDATSRNCKPPVMDALHAGAGVRQPVGTAASGRASKLGGVVLAMDENTASCMNFHRSTPWRRQVS